MAGCSERSEVHSDDESDHRQFQSFVSEAGEFSGLLAALGSQNESSSADALKRLEEIFGKYQEQSELLDPHLESVVLPLLDSIRSVSASIRSDAAGAGAPPTKALLHRLFRLLYCLCKVRGHKTVVRFLPHQVADLEPALALLALQNPAEHDTWEIRYGLLLWLSIIVLIPFDLATVEDETAARSGKGIVHQLVSHGKQYLSDSGACREVAGLMLARLFSRPDMQRAHLAEFFTYCRERLSLPGTVVPIIELTGVLGALAQIYKLAPRDALRAHSSQVYEAVLRTDSVTSGGTPEEDRWAVDRCRSGLVRHLVVKLAQRVGLVYLRPTVAPWRYHRGHRSLLQSLQQAGVESAKVQAARGGAGGPGPGSGLGGTQRLGGGDGGAGADDAGVDYDVPMEIDDVVNRLLQGLRDTDTVVRWSAAKGVGRITARLPADFADDVVAAVLDLFSAAEGDGAWHGGCLALAELARRGLLLPHRLQEVVPLVVRALVYDVRRGAHSVGAHVRDAACYVCWAFARAYEPSLMEPHVPRLAPQLLAVAVYDREINCRRAAAAAFQENVGRQGNFPHGIAINTAADYFTLGNRNTAYLEVGQNIAQYAAYTRRLVDHLVQHKVPHWDGAIRELAALALHSLCLRDADYLQNIVVPLLLPSCTARDLAERHGSILALGEILTGLRRAGRRVRPDIQAEVVAVARSVDERRLLQGRGGQLMRAALMHLVCSVARAALPLVPEEVEALLSHVVQNLEHNDEDIQYRAAVAGAAFCRRYFAEGGGPYPVFDSAARKWVGAARRVGLTPYPRRGACLLLGMLPHWLLRPHLSQVVDALAAACKVEPGPTGNDVETRRNAVGALGEVCVEVGGHATLRAGGAGPVLLDRALPVLLEAMGDYAVDNRGDVGSWVREAAMVGMHRALLAVCGHPPGRRPRLYSVPVVESAREEARAQEMQSQERQEGGDKAGTSASSSGALRSGAAECDGDGDGGGGGGGSGGGSGEGTIVVDGRHGDDEDEGARGSGPSHSHAELVGPGLVRSVIAALLKQMAEKINRMRGRAGSLLYSLLYMENPSLPHVPHRDELLAIFDREVDRRIDWSSPSMLFPLLGPVLSLELYCRPLLEGMVISVGGLTESLVRSAGDALVAAVSSMRVWPDADPRERERVPPAGTVDRVGFDLVAILQENRGRPRVVVPALKATDLLLNQGSLLELTPSHCAFALELHRVVHAELFRSSDIVKLMAGANVHLGLVQFADPARAKGLRSALILLCHRFPKVRRTVGEQMYNRLLTYELGLSDDALDEALAILSETPWDGPILELRPQRDRLFPLLGVEKPDTLVLGDAEQDQLARDEGGDCKPEEQHTYAEFLSTL